MEPTLRANSSAGLMRSRALGCNFISNAPTQPPLRDRVVAELRDVFADVAPSAVREELLALVAEHLALDPCLVNSWMPAPVEAGGAT
jgi:hypothetical protein